MSTHGHAALSELQSKIDTIVYSWAPRRFEGGHPAPHMSVPLATKPHSELHQPGLRSHAHNCVLSLKDTRAWNFIGTCMSQQVFTSGFCLPDLMQELISRARQDNLLSSAVHPADKSILSRGCVSPVSPDLPKVEG